MNRWNIALLLCAAVLVGCGKSGGAGEGGGGTTDAVSLATTMIAEATSEECPTQEHCAVWPVESLATVSRPDDAHTLDL